WDTHRAMRYGFLPETAQTPSFHIASRDGEATFSDVELHARLLAVAAREGLRLDGQEFTLHVRPGRWERKRETGRDQRSRQERTSQ
ncbi:MAG: hypothetical protein LBP86_12150, partial [Azoarcus sp.]|nr:hypothetical protein [Azoarcus sp.]